MAFKKVLWNLLLRRLAFSALAFMHVTCIMSPAHAQNRLSKDTNKTGVYYTSNVTKSTSASVGTTSVVIAEANPKRRGIIIYNNSGNSAYVTYGPVSVSASCTRILATFNQFEMMGPVVYTGPISAIRNSGSGTLTITEIE